MVNSINNSIDTIKSDSTTDTTQQSASHLSEMDKKIRNLTKKLRQIAELKERQKNGDKLELTQVLPSCKLFLVLKVLLKYISLIIPGKKNRNRRNITERIGTFETSIDYSFRVIKV